MSEENLDSSGEAGEVQQESLSPELEREARLYGWVPREEFRGKEEDWVEASHFVARGKEIQPLLKKNNERLLKEIAKRDTQLAELDLTVKEFGEMYKTMSENAYKRAITDVKAQIREARRSDDHEQVDTLTEQLGELTEQSKNIVVPGKRGEGTSAVRGPSRAERERTMDTWVEENPWYNEETNPDLFYAAEGIAMKFANTPEGRQLAGTRAFLDEVKDRVRRAMPDRFKNPRRANGSPVSGNSQSRSSGPANNGKRSYSDLPADAKAACDRQVKTIPGFTREKYVEYYFEQPGA